MCLCKRVWVAPCGGLEDGKMKKATKNNQDKNERSNERRRFPKIQKYSSRSTEATTKQATVGPSVLFLLCCLCTPPKPCVNPLFKLEAASSDHPPPPPPAAGRATHNDSWRRAFRCRRRGRGRRRVLAIKPSRRTTAAAARSKAEQQETDAAPAETDCEVPRVFCT